MVAGRASTRPAHRLRRYRLWLAARRVDLCLLAVVLLVLRYGRERTQALGRVFALGMGLLLLGLTVAGLVGTVLSAQAHHSRPAILKALDASSYAVGYLTTLAVAGCFCVLGLARRQESV